MGSVLTEVSSRNLGPLVMCKCKCQRCDTLALFSGVVTVGFIDRLRIRRERSFRVERAPVGAHLRMAGALENDAAR